MVLAPFAALSPESGRGVLEKMTKGDGWFWRGLGRLLQPMIGVGAQVVYFGYYGDEPPSSRSATSALPTDPIWSEDGASVTPNPMTGLA